MVFISWCGIIIWVRTLLSVQTVFLERRAGGYAHRWHGLFDNVDNIQMYFTNDVDIKHSIDKYMLENSLSKLKDNF